MYPLFEKIAYTSIADTDELRVREVYVYRPFHFQYTAKAIKTVLPKVVCISKNMQHIQYISMLVT